MDSEQKSHYSLYALYFDKRKSTRSGRKVPLAISIERPNPIILHKCAEHLGYTASLETSKRHPRDPTVFGRVKVKIPLNVSKHSILIEICKVYQQVKPVVEQQFAASSASNTEKSPSSENAGKKGVGKEVAISPDGVVLMARSKKNKKT